MNAHKATITSIFDGTTLIEIPFFQRSYVWDKYLWERFLNDMEFTVKTKSPHFLGTLIFKDNGTPKSSEPYSTQLLLIDGQQRLTTYFQLFIQNKKYSISTEDKLIYARTDRLSNSYQSFVDNYCGGSKQIILSSLREYAELFRKTFQPDICDTTIPSTFGIERLNVVIFGLKTTTLIPYVLYLAKNISDTTALNKMYGILESYVMRRIVTHATSKNYNNLFLSLIANEILDADDLRTRLQAASGTNSYIPTDTELQDGFEHSKLMNLYSKGVLYLIESHIRPAQSAVVLHGFNNYSLEHLMPKKWRNNWPACPTPLDAEKRDSILLTLGNLAIIPQSLNASIRDSDWNTKKAGKGQEKPGLTLCASGLSTLQDALTKTDWNESEIQARALWLYKQAKSLWKL